jgi:hypothetical protein
MIRLNADQDDFPGIRVENCGMLFLATPHSGTIQADWNKYLLGLAELGGVRKDVLQDLHSFNGFSVESKKAFRKIPAKPPFFCFSETKKVKIAGEYRLVSSIYKIVRLVSISNLALGCFPGFC